MSSRERHRRVDYTRVTTFHGVAGISPAFVEDSECKIIAFDTAAFAVTGIADYVPNWVGDPLSAWDSRTDARHAYSDQHADLIATANDWTSRAKEHYQAFYRAAPQRVAELAKLNVQNVLLVGIFVGFQDNKPELIIRAIILNEAQLPPIVDSQLTVGPRDALFSTNAITQDLIDGLSDRAKTTEAAWQKAIKSIPESKQAARHLEFLIQNTSTFDHSVGTVVNILELKPKGNTRWLQSPTCLSK